MSHKLIVQLEVRCPNCDDRLALVPKTEHISDINYRYYHRGCSCSNQTNYLIRIPISHITYEVVE